MVISTKLACNADNSSDVLTVRLQAGQMVETVTVNLTRVK